MGKIYLEVSACIIILKSKWRRTRKKNGCGSVEKSLLSSGSAPMLASERFAPGKVALYVLRWPSRASAAKPFRLGQRALMCGACVTKANFKPRGTAFYELNYAGEAGEKIRKPTR